MNAYADVPAGLYDAPSDLQTFYRAWSACRKDVIVPHLRDYLDAPELRLQAQVAIGDIYGPNDIRLRLFGGGLADMAGQDYTNRPIDPLLNPEAKAAGGAVAWAAVRHPAGFRTLLNIKTSNGYALQCHSISLPLVPPVGVPYCIITMIQIPNTRVKLAREEDGAFVSSHNLQSWIDIGAGVPAQRPSTGHQT